MSLVDELKKPTPRPLTIDALFTRISEIREAWTKKDEKHLGKFEHQMLYLIGERGVLGVDNDVYYDACFGVMLKPYVPEGRSLSIEMVLYCPRCGTQHVDAPDGEWTNPPHRSHLCHECSYVWRPADVPTTGVKAIHTRGKEDSPPLDQVHAAQSAVRDIVHAAFHLLDDSEEGEGGVLSIDNDIAAIDLRKMHDALDRLEINACEDIDRALACRPAAPVCQFDTNGDGDCGRLLCPACGYLRHMRITGEMKANAASDLAEAVRKLELTATGHAVGADKSGDRYQMGFANGFHACWKRFAEMLASKRGSPPGTGG